MSEAEVLSRAVLGPPGITSQALLEQALVLAESGSRVVILARQTLPEFALLARADRPTGPHILERLNFRYLSSGEELVQWCHHVHGTPRPPSALFLCRAQDFAQTKHHLFQVCAALLDAAACLSKRCRSPTHLYVSLNSFQDLKAITLLNLFQEVKTINES